MRIGRAVILIAFLTACGPSLTPSGSANPPSPDSPSIASAARISNPPVTPPTPPGTNLPAFACADASGGKVGVANAITARVAEQQGYDRFVLQLDSIVPSYTVTRQAKPVFPQPSGQSVTLAGNTGVLVTVHSATAATTFVGQTDITTPGFAVLQEARQTQDFEGYVSWGLGLKQAACMRVFVLDAPARLVVDFQLPSS